MDKLTNGASAPTKITEKRPPAGWLKTKDKLHPIFPDVNSIGRHINASIKLDNQTVSQYHSMIVVLEDSRIYVSDLRSSNGSKLNKKAMEPLKLLQIKPGDLLEFGEVSCTFSENKSTTVQLEESQTMDQSIFALNTQLMVPENRDVDINNAATQPSDDFHFAHPPPPVDFHDMPTQDFAPSIHDQMTQMVEIADTDENLSAEATTSTKKLSIHDMATQIVTFDTTRNDNSVPQTNEDSVVQEDEDAEENPSGEATSSHKQLSIHDMATQIATFDTTRNDSSVAQTSEDSVAQEDEDPVPDFVSQIRPVQLGRKRTVDSDDEATQTVQDEDSNDSIYLTPHAPSQINPVQLSAKRAIESDEEDESIAEVPAENSEAVSNEVESGSTQTTIIQNDINDESSNDSVTFMPNTAKPNPARESPKAAVKTGEKPVANSRFLSSDSGSETDAEMDTSDLIQSSQVPPKIVIHAPNDSFTKSVIEDSLLAETETTLVDQSLLDSTNTDQDETVENAEGEKRIDERLCDTQTADMFSTQELHNLLEESKTRLESYSRKNQDTLSTSKQMNDEIADVFLQPTQKTQPKTSAQNDEIADIFLQPTQKMQSEISTQNDDDDVFMQPTQLMNPTTDSNEINNDHIESTQPMNPKIQFKESDFDSYQKSQQDVHKENIPPLEQNAAKLSDDSDDDFLFDKSPAKDQTLTKDDLATFSPGKALEMLNKDTCSPKPSTSKAGDGFAMTQQLADVLEDRVEDDFAVFQPTQALKLLTREKSPDKSKSLDVEAFAATQQLKEALQGDVEEDLRKITEESTDTKQNGDAELIGTQQLKDILDSPKVQKAHGPDKNDLKVDTESQKSDGSVEVRRSARNPKKPARIVDSSDSDEETPKVQEEQTIEQSSRGRKKVTVKPLIFSEESEIETPKVKALDMNANKQGTSEDQKKESVEVKKSARGRKKKEVTPVDSSEDTDIEEEKRTNAGSSKAVTRTKVKRLAFSEESEIETPNVVLETDKKANKEGNSEDQKIERAEVKKSKRGRKKKEVMPMDSSEDTEIEEEKGTNAGGSKAVTRTKVKPLTFSEESEIETLKVKVLETDQNANKQGNKIVPKEESVEVKKSTRRGKKKEPLEDTDTDIEEEKRGNAGASKAVTRTKVKPLAFSEESEIETPNGKLLEKEQKKKSSEESVEVKKSKRGRKKKEAVDSSEDTEVEGEKKRVNVVVPRTRRNQKKAKIVDTSDSDLEVPKAKKPQENDAPTSTKKRANTVKKTSDKSTIEQPSASKGGGKPMTKRPKITNDDSLSDSSDFEPDTHFVKPTSTSRPRRNIKKSIDPDEIPLLKSTRKATVEETPRTAGKRRLFRLSSVNLDEAQNNDEAERELQKSILLKRSTRSKETDEPATKSRRLSANSKRERREASTSSDHSSTERRKSTRQKIVFTMMNNPELQTLVRSLDGSVVEDVQEATVLITNEVKRTHKLLCAVALGIPVCSEQWLWACKKAHSFLDPWAHIIRDKNAEQKWQFSLEESLKKGKSQRLLNGFSFKITITAGAGVIDVLKGSIEASGGKILRTLPKTNDDQFYIISTAEFKSKWPKNSAVRFRVIEPEAIFDGILRQELRFERHLLN